MEELRIKSRISNSCLYEFRYKSLINRILKNEEMDDVDEIKAI